MKKLLNMIRSVSAGNMGKACLSLLAACVLAAGCGPVDTAPALGEGDVIEIRQGTTGAFEGLRIGLSSIGETGNAGEKKRLVAVLVLFIKGNPPQEKRFDVQAGQTVKLDRYSVYAQEIRGGSKGSVRLEVKAGG